MRRDDNTVLRSATNTDFHVAVPQLIAVIVDVALVLRRIRGRPIRAEHLDSVDGGCRKVPCKDCGWSDVDSRNCNSDWDSSDQPIMFLREMPPVLLHTTIQPGPYIARPAKETYIACERTSHD